MNSLAAPILQANAFARMGWLNRCKEKNARNRAVLFSVAGAQPVSARQDFLQRILIDEWHDRLIEGVFQVEKFLRTSFRASLGEKVDAQLPRLAGPHAGPGAFNKILECFWIAAIGDAEIVIEALRLRA